MSLAVDIYRFLKHHVIIVYLLFGLALGTSRAARALLDRGMRDVDMMSPGPFRFLFRDGLAILDLVAKELDVLLILVTPVVSFIGLVLDGRSVLLLGRRDGITDRRYLALGGLGFSFLEDHCFVFLVCELYSASGGRRTTMERPLIGEIFLASPA